MRAIRLGAGVLAAALAGCGSQSVRGVPTPADSAAAAHTALARIDTAKGRGHSLLYASYGEDVNVYTYPQGRSLGSLGNIGGSLCSDSAGDVFDATQDQILVYAHGAEMPKAVLNDPTFAGPCSVDPTSGSVASAVGVGAQVVIFPYSRRNGWRFAKTYSVPNMEFTHYVGYDASGNLFADGSSTSGSFEFAKLGKGGHEFQAITLKATIFEAGPIQWDGRYLTVADRGQSSTVIEQVEIEGSSGSEVGSTKLDDSFPTNGYWIEGKRVTGAHVQGRYTQGIGIWRYPAGGKPLKVFANDSGADDVTISVP